MKLLSARIKRIHRSSEKAIAKFMTTEQRLRKQNEQIDAAVSELDTKIAELNELRIAATYRKQENEGIVRRISRIIYG